MAEDDKETSDERGKDDVSGETADSPGRARDPKEKAKEEAKEEGGRAPARPLPPRVERALAKARAAARADHERKGGRWLAVIPLGVAVVLLLLLMPRATVPEAVPLPLADQRVLRRLVREDDTLAAEAEKTRLPSAVLAIGSAFRSLNEVQARDGTEGEIADTRRELDASLRELMGHEGFAEQLRSLRALQTRHFLDALTRWEATGETDAELRALAGNFVKRITEAGWAKDRRILLTDTQRRIMFKTVWNAVMGVENVPALATTLDEQRELYAFYLGHPHPPENRRAMFDAQRRAATTPSECARVDAEESRQTELWRVDKIRKLSAIDPTYPGSYALGVAFYRAGRYDLSVEAFNAFLQAHPDGPYALTAKNHLKAALVAHGTL